VPVADVQVFAVEAIERIAEEVGYSDVRSFRRAFKRWAGMSLTAFRNESALLQ